MRYESQKTDKGNIGVSYESQQAADEQAAVMDKNNCTNCTNCRYCTNCTNCTNCRYCRYCTNCTNCTSCTSCRYCKGVLTWKGGDSTNLLAVNGLTWPVAISKNKMQIGCQCHLIEEWNNFDDEAILKMDGKTALKFWRQWGDNLLSLCAAHKEKN